MPTGVVKRGRGRPPKSAKATAAAALAAYTKVSKSNAAVGKQEKIVSTPVTPVKTKVAIQTPTPTTTNTTRTTRKRKAEVAAAPESSDDEATPTKATSLTARSTRYSSKRARRSNTDQDSSPQQPVSTQPKYARASSTDSDISAANNVLERLRIGSSQPSSSGYSTPATTDDEGGIFTVPKPSSLNSATLPQDLLDLLALHSAFLKTLSLHAAHTGAGAPIELKALNSDISRTWGKRGVTVDDIRVCVALLEYNQSQKHSAFRLADYGRNKVHLEIGSTALPLNEPALNASFENTLKALWARERGNYYDARGFITALPRANIVKNPISKVAKLGKDQQTLEDFRASIEAKKAEKARIEEAKKAAVDQPQQKLNLLDRIRMKAEAAKQLATTAPSPHEVARRRALMRVEDVAAVLSMLCTSQAGSVQARLSLPMQIVQGKLKDSLRVSISREEAVDVVRIIGREIAPEWLRTVTAAGREHVILMLGSVPCAAEISNRVQRKL